MTSHESEQVVISAIFNLPGYLGRYRDQIAAGLFAHDTHKSITSAILAVGGVGDTPDFWAVTNRLGQGLASAVTELAAPDRIPSADEAQRHLRAVRAAFERREMAGAYIKAAELLQTAPLFAEDGAPDLSAQVEDILADAGKLPGKTLLRRHIKDVIPDVFSEIEQRASHPGRLAGISTGIASLDRKTAGMMPGHVWVFAGLPGDGKSTLMQNCAEAAAFAGHRVAWYPLEMPDTEQVFRLLASASEVDNSNLFSGILSGGEMAALQAATRRLKDSPINLVNIDGVTASDILHDIEMSSCEIAVVDYLQLLEPGEIRKGESREQVISTIARQLKNVARRTGKVILTGSQLNDDGRLRESRAIGQHADKVMVINKAALEGGEKGETDDTRRDLYCAKNRGLARNWTLPLYFLGHVFQFKEIHEDPAI